MMRSISIGLLTAAMLLTACGPSMAADELTDEPITQEPTAEATPTLAPTETATPPPSPTPEPTANEVVATIAPPADLPAPLAVVLMHGGLCMYGGCEATLTVYDNGAYRTINGNGMGGGFLEAAQLEDLRNAISQTDFDAIRSVPFTDVCPTAYDGAEVVYTLYTDAGEQRIPSCEYAIDMTLPLFTLLNEWAASLWQSDDGEAPLVKVSRFGVMGVQVFTVDAAGNYITSNNHTGTLTTEQMAELQALIEQTDFEALQESVYGGTCPLAYDAPIVGYSFSMSYGVEDIVDCRNVIDHSLPLIAWVDALEKELSEE